MRRVSFLPAALAVLLAVPLAAPPAAAVTFRWANDGDLGALDPYTRDETVQLSFTANIYEPLVRRDPRMGLEPALATRWEQVEPTVWRFHLRPGVKWQDGTAFTADDVVFSAGRITAPSSIMKPVLAQVAETRKVDDLTVDVVTRGPDPILPQEVAQWYIMSKAWCEAHGTTVPAVITLNEENYAVRNAMGTGPFRVVLREPDRRTVLERNPLWWDAPHGNVDRVEFNVIGSAATRTAALLSGEMDMIYAVPTQDMDRIAHTPGVHLIEGPELRTIYLGMDQSRPELLKSNVKGRNPFRDRRVREAFALAIDETLIAGRVMRGQARPTWLMWGEGVTGFDPALNARPAADPARAKALLAEAGYPDGFTVGMDCTNDRYVNDEAICTAIGSMLARVGVTVQLAAVTKSRFFAEVGFPRYNTSLFMLGWTPSTGDAHNVMDVLMHTRANGRGIGNDGGFSNARVDTLTDEVATELDNEKRLDMIREAARIVQHEVGFIPLHQQAIVWAARNNVDLVQLPTNYFPLMYVRVK